MFGMHTFTIGAHGVFISMQLLACLLLALPTDPDTLEPLLNNEGWVYSMDVYRRLARLNPLYTPTWNDSDPSCRSGAQSFLNGRGRGL
jgi:hypothetical protein